METILTLILLGTVLLVPLAYVIGQYNGFVVLRNHTNEAGSNIDTELKRRHDLVPNLVTAVRAYAAHENEVLERVTKIREACLEEAASGERQVAGENKLAGALRQLLAVVENYPTLKADAGFLKLHDELIHTEDRLQAARRFYNGNVRDYRNKRESFPTNLIASAFHFPPLNFLEIEPAVRAVPEVSL